MKYSFSKKCGWIIQKSGRSWIKVQACLNNKYMGGLSNVGVYIFGKPIFSLDKDFSDAFTAFTYAIALAKRPFVAFLPDWIKWKMRLAAHRG